MTQDLVKWDEELARFAQEQKQAEPLPISQISLKSGVMSFRNQPVPGNALKVIILASAEERRFYNERYNPEKKISPKCFSLDGQKPHPNVHEPVHATCEGCPMDHWGSDINGGKGKGCKQVRKLLLAAAGEANYEVADLALLRIPVTSVRNYSLYVNEVATLTRRPTWAVITEVSVVPDAKTQFKVQFKYIGPVGPEHLAAIKERGEQNADVLNRPYDMSEGGEDAPASDAKVKY